MNVDTFSLEGSRLLCAVLIHTCCVVLVLDFSTESQSNLLKSPQQSRHCENQRSRRPGSSWAAIPLCDAQASYKFISNTISPVSYLHRSINLRTGSFSIPSNGGRMLACANVEEPNLEKLSLRVSSKNVMEDDNRFLVGTYARTPSFAEKEGVEMEAERATTDDSYWVASGGC
ncbi:hypothetical protein LguiB_030793 [Lonicera macranthoides]